MGERSAPFVAAVAVAVVHGERVLVARRAPSRRAGAGLWEVPAGRLRPGEEPWEAARRELREETGLSVPLERRPVDAFPGERAGRPMLVVLYRAVLDATAPPPAVTLDPEHDAMGWWTLEEAARSNMPERLREALARALADATGG